MPEEEVTSSEFEGCKLVSRKDHLEDTVINVGDVEIGSKRVVVMAGPCAVESEGQVMECARSVKEAGALILRGGAFKPRSSPYSFQGLGEDGLKILANVRDETGLPVVTEVMDSSDIDMVGRYADIFQIGSRNMQNFTLLKSIGKTTKPVLLKRGMGNTIEELLMAAEYIMSEGNRDVILCERGIRTFENYSRFTLDISAVPVIKNFSHLPVIIDPSHSSGRSNLVTPLTRAAVAAGADGLLIEVHPEPEQALCDGDQSLNPKEFKALMKELKYIATAVNREL